MGGGTRGEAVATCAAHSRARPATVAYAPCGWRCLPFPGVRRPVLVLGHRPAELGSMAAQLGLPSHPDPAQERRCKVRFPHKGRPDSHTRDRGQGPPGPNNPFPGCPHLLGSLFPQVLHFRLSLPLRGPSPRAAGHTDRLAGTHRPATGRSAGHWMAGASSGNAHKTDPHSLPGRPGPSRRK